MWEVFEPVYVGYARGFAGFFLCVLLPFPDHNLLIGLLDKEHLLPSGVRSLWVQYQNGLFLVYARQVE